MSAAAPRAVILVATDRSDVSNEALSAGARLARATPGSELHVVSVLDSREIVERDDAVDEESARVADAARSHGIEGAVIHVEDGVAWREIVALGERLRADLIVVGADDRSAFRRILLGSIAEQVVSHARCPIFVARKREYAAA